MSEDLAAAAARRDRARMAAVAAELAWLRRRVQELEASPLRRATQPVRRMLQRRRSPPPALPGPHPGRGLALVLDHAWPQPDRDAGSIEIVNLVQALSQLGFSVVVAASTQHAGPQPARDRLAARGIRCLAPADAASTEAWLEQHGHRLDLCVLCRVFCGGAFLEQVQRVATKARLVFNSIDLNWVREMRRAEITGDAALAGMIDMLRTREQHVIRSCDATIVVSESEAALLAAEVPGGRVAVLPLARLASPPRAGFAERDGCGFVGNFAHAPNTDAMRWFLASVWPLVRRELPEARMSIAGPDAPAELQHVPGATVLGHVPDLTPWFEGLRATVAPLRYGAGSKGKIASSLAAGVPCVITPVAAEGMGLREDDGVLIAADAAGLAAELVRLQTDEALWRACSEGALRYAEERLSMPAWQARLDRLLQTIGL